MCGLAGYIGSLNIDEGPVKKCLERMGRRGPDARGVWRYTSPEGRHILLLHSRLAIIDIDPRSNQPFQDGNTTIIFNGELYNYRELRRELEEQDVLFQTSSDTEVLLKALNVFGREGLQRCEGMWAFARYDAEAGEILLCRDRFGEKPLYLYRDGTGIYFASEIKCLQALAQQRFTIDTDYLCRFLVHGYTSIYKTRRSFFTEVTELSPATALCIDRSGVERISPYWQPVFNPDQGMEYTEAVAGVRERLFTAVDIRLRADVPLAFCLSGGVDSNSLIGIAKRVLDYDVHGFTIVNTDARYDEQEMVEYAVRELGVRHTEIPVSTDHFLNRMRTLVCYHDAPVATITYYAHWLLMESIAGHGYKIALSGTGADEIFSGYYDHHLAYLQFLHQERDTHYQTALADWTEHIRPLVQNPFLRDPDLFVRDPGFRGHITLDAGTFANYLNEPWSEPFSEASYTATLLRNRMANELFHENVPVILHEEDLNAMYYSVENRSPFLDRKLFEFCASIPTRHLVREGRAKALLRDAMHGIAPEKILNNRKKTGFNAPIYSFLDRGAPDVMDELLRDSPIFTHVKRQAIKELLAKPRLSNSESKFLFSFLSCKLFLEEFSP